VVGLVYSRTRLGNGRLRRWLSRRRSVVLCHRLIGREVTSPEGPASIVSANDKLTWRFTVGDVGQRLCPRWFFCGLVADWRRGQQPPVSHLVEVEVTTTYLDEMKVAPPLRRSRWPPEWSHWSFLESRCRGAVASSPAAGTMTGVALPLHGGYVEPD
jgi:hypothetical protein